MKKRFYIKTALSLIFMALLSSCLKNSKYAVDFAGTKPLVELPGAANVTGVSGPFEAFAFSISSTATPFNVPVNIAAPKPLGSALTVKLSVDQAALDAYNAANDQANGFDYTLLPTSDYSSTLTVTIPAGQNLGNVVVNINTSQIDPSQNYVLPLTITDAGGQQISNYKTILYNIQVKNAWDGEYTVVGTLNDTVVPTITGSYPIDADLITAGANSDYMFTNTFGTAGHDISSGGVKTIYGSFSPQFTFGSSTITSVVNAYGQPAGNGRSARLDATGVDALTGTPGVKGFSFKVSYVLVASGTDRTFFTETWTYKGPR